MTTSVVSRQQIAAEARTYIGTPFHHQAYVKRHGCDCIGLVAGVALHFGLPGAAEWKSEPRFHNYTRQPDPKLLLEGCERFLERANDLVPELADILVMRFEYHPMHFAIVSGVSPVYVVHALSLLGRVAEHGLQGRWRSNVFRVYRFRGVG